MGLRSLDIGGCIIYTLEWARDPSIGIYGTVLQTGDCVGPYTHHRADWQDAPVLPNDLWADAVTDIPCQTVGGHLRFSTLTHRAAVQAHGQYINTCILRKRYYEYFSTTHHYIHKQFLPFTSHVNLVYWHTILSWNIKGSQMWRLKTGHVPL